jgi:hypothetical protein
VAAVIALVVIPWQIRESDQISRRQTAREIYREFLSLTVQKPELATADWCALKDDKDRVAYEAYVDYLLYTAEQVLEAEPGWDRAMQEHLADHLPLLCARVKAGPGEDALGDVLAPLLGDCGQMAQCEAGAP